MKALWQIFGGSNFYCKFTCTNNTNRMFKKSVRLGFCNRGCSLDRHCRHWKYFTYNASQQPRISEHPELHFQAYNSDDSDYFLDSKSNTWRRGKLNKKMLSEKLRRLIDTFKPNISNIERKNETEIRKLVEDLEMKNVITPFKQSNIAKSDDSDRENFSTYISYVENETLIKQNIMLYCTSIDFNAMKYSHYTLDDWKLLLMSILKCNIESWSWLQDNK